MAKTMTAKQRTALKKAQAASARKRRRRRRVVGAAATVAVIGAAGYAAHRKGYRAQVSHSKGNKKTKRVSVHRSSQHVAVRGRVGKHNVAIGGLAPKRRKRTKAKARNKPLSHSQIYGAYAKQNRKR